MFKGREEELSALASLLAAGAGAKDFWEASGSDDWREVGGVEVAAAKSYQGGFRADGKREITLPPETVRMLDFAAAK